MVGLIDDLIAMGYTKKEAEDAAFNTGFAGKETALIWLDFKVGRRNSVRTPEEVKAKHSAKRTKSEASKPRLASIKEERYRCNVCMEVFDGIPSLERHATETKHGGVQLCYADLTKRQPYNERSDLDKFREWREIEIYVNQQRKRREELEKNPPQVTTSWSWARPTPPKQQKLMVPILPIPPPLPVAPTAKANYTQTKLLIRLPDGSTMNETFDVDWPLAEVKLFIELYRTDGITGKFNLSTKHPSVVYDDGAWEISLADLELVPTAVIYVTQVGEYRLISAKTPENLWRSLLS